MAPRFGMAPQAIQKPADALACLRSRQRQALTLPAATRTVCCSDGVKYFLDIIFLFFSWSNLSPLSDGELSIEAAVRRGRRVAVEGGGAHPFWRNGIR
jgi:hypothetical protein